MAPMPDSPASSRWPTWPRCSTHVERPGLRAGPPGDLPAIKIGGRGQWRVEGAELEKFIERMYAETKTFVSDHPFVESDAGRGERTD